MADHGAHHHEGETASEIKSKTAFISSFWFVIILVGLFIAALNFINVMGSDQGHKNHEATASQTLKGETGLGREAKDTTQFHPAATAGDSIHREMHNN